jgi:hypothetical protein
MGTSVPAYRAYFIDEGDHIAGTEVVRADGLGQAIDKALPMLADVPRLQSIELWKKGRRLCSVVPAPHLRAQILAQHEGDLDDLAALPQQDTSTVR